MTAAADSRPLRIRMVSRFDVCGGAEIVAQDQWNELRRRGHDVRLIVGEKRSSAPDIEDASAVPFGRPRARWWRDVLAGADVVHLHNLHGGYVPWAIIRWAAKHSVVVVTMHDQFLFTGGCVHTYGCDRWDHGCGHCPQRTGPGAREDDTAVQWQRKSKLWAASEVHAVAPARWIYERARLSMLSRGPGRVSHIPNGVDTRIFRPREKSMLRARYGIPPDCVVLFTSGYRLKSNYSKDWALLGAVLPELASRSSVPVVLFVAGDVGTDVSSERLTVRFLGTVTSREEMADYYALADIYVHPSRAETFSLAILEAMASGCAIVASPVGGVDEQLNPDGGVASRGLVIQANRPELLAASLERLIHDGALRARLGGNAVEQVSRDWTLDRHVDAHLEVYRTPSRRPTQL